MNKTAIKNYAVWARVQLIEAVKQRAFEYEITESGEYNANLDSINGRVLTAEEKEQRSRLIELIKQKGYEQVMEEAAYTWFNRFIALRFMEVNGYLPSKTRVFTDENNQFKPEILKQAMTVELDGLDREKVYDLLDKQNNEELYKYLLITQCNALNAALPDMFEKIANWTELLFPNNLLKADSVLERMIKEIPEDNWTDQVEIIGWLYQYYNTEPKDKVFARPSGQKIRKEDVPAATQLFTPDWIVRYMVENSLGRIAVSRELSAFSFENEQQRQEKEKEIAQSHGWKYYLAEAEQTPEVRAQLNADSKDQNTDLTQICVLDPCMGSGHILVYAFDVFMEIYKSQGYSERDAAQEIVRNNLYGLELDDRAAQLAYFAVMMKARSYDRRFLTRGIYPYLCSIQESNSLNTDYLELFGELKPTAQKLVDEFIDAKEYGSILNLKITADEIAQLESKYNEINDAEYDNIFNTIRQIGLRTVFVPLIRQAKIMAKKYNVVCTNPPYMGGSGMSAKLSAFVKKKYPDSKADLFAVFMEKCNDYTAQGCYTAMITMHSWMFLSSFEKLREKLLLQTTVNMAHLGARAFDQIGGEVVQTTAFVNRKEHIKNYLSTYKRLIEQNSENGKREAFLTADYDYTANADNFSKIPGSPVAYWVSTNFINAFDNKTISNYAEVITGMTIGDNNKYLRIWYEVSNRCINLYKKSMEEIDVQKRKWIPYSKGGARRNWYGNYEYVVNWSQKDHFNRSKTTLQHLYLREALTWPFVTSGGFSARILPNGFLWDVAGSPCFFDNQVEEKYVLGFMASKVCNTILNVTNPTINVQAIDVARLPIVFVNETKNSIVSFVEENISLSRNDWDSFETSWDFKKHPLI